MKCTYWCLAFVANDGQLENWDGESVGNDPQTLLNGARTTRKEAMADLQDHKQPDDRWFGVVKVTVEAVIPMAAQKHIKH
jgi:hypothetical protein